MKSLLRIRSKLLVIIIAAIIVSCSDNSTDPIFSPIKRGDIVSISSIGNYSTLAIQQMFVLAGVEMPYPAENSVEIFKIEYLTIDSDGNLITVSGAVMKPIKAGSVPMLSLQHGTVTERTEVASNGPLSSIEGAVGVYAASLGYYTLVPDYPGFGSSNTIHPYVHDKSLAYSVIDNIRAGKLAAEIEGISMNGELFLTGYSEGGYATLAAHREIETNHVSEFNLTAVAPMAGPYDLTGTFAEILEQGDYSPLVYVGYFFTVYNEIYGWNYLSNIFLPPYADLMPGLFDGTQTYSEISSQLPGSLTDLVKQSFITSYLNGNETEVIAAVAENTLLNWTPTVPMRFYHGRNDDTVPYQNSVTIVNNLKANGGFNIELITIEDGDHGSAAMPAFLDVIEWFKTFQNDNIYAKF